jgi:MFS family permease
MTQAGVIEEFNIGSSLEFSWLPFFANLASFVAAIVIGKLIDKFGRKWAFIACITTSSFFAIACAFATSFPLLTFFRSVVGFGLGGIAVIDYVVLVECCPEVWRNTASQIVFVSGCFGVIYVALLFLIPFGSFINNDEISLWRIYMFLGGLPLLGTVGLRFLISTDTPKFLVASGRVSAAYALLVKMKTTNESNCFASLPSVITNPFFVSEEDFHNRVAEEKLLVNRSERGSLSQVLRTSVTGPLAVVWIVQSLVYWGLTIFLPEVLKSSGISLHAGLLAMGLAELPGVVIATFISQKKGRDVSLMFCFTLSFLGALYTGTAVLVGWSPIAVVSGACLFYMFLIPCWGILFVMTPEIYPVSLRGMAVGFHHMCKSVPSLAAPFIGAAILEGKLEGAFMFIWAGILGIGLSMTFLLHRKLRAHMGLG